MTQKKRTTAPRHDRSHDVGYKRPPISTRFPKGQSGNPAGRPKSPTRLDAVLKSELDTMITLRIDGKSREINKREAIVRRLFAKALDGDLRAIEMFLHHLKREAADPLPPYIIRHEKDELINPAATTNPQGAGETKHAGSPSATDDRGGARSHVGNDGSNEASENPQLAPDVKATSESNRPAQSSCAADVSTAAHPHTASYGAISQPSLSTAAVRMRAPKPHHQFYVNDATSGVGRYTSAADGIIENVHPDHVPLLMRSGCVRS